MMAGLIASSERLRSPLERHRTGKALVMPLFNGGRQRKICSIGLRAQALRERYCKTHYERARKGRAHQRPYNQSGVAVIECTWCDKTARKGVSGYCVGHYERHLKGQDLDLPYRHTDMIRAKVARFASSQETIQK